MPYSHFSSSSHLFFDPKALHPKRGLEASKKNTSILAHLFRTDGILMGLRPTLLFVLVIATATCDCLRRQVLFSAT